MFLPVATGPQLIAEVTFLYLVPSIVLRLGRQQLLLLIMVHWKKSVHVKVLESFPSMAPEQGEALHRSDNNLGETVFRSKPPAEGGGASRWAQAIDAPATSQAPEDQPSLSWSRDPGELVSNYISRHIPVSQGSF